MKKNYQIKNKKETTPNLYFRADISFNMKSEPETCLYRFPAHQRICTFCSVFNFFMVSAFSEGNTFAITFVMPIVAAIFCAVS